MAMMTESDNTFFNGKADPFIAIKYESMIMSCTFFLFLDSVISLIAGGLATRYFTTMYIGALAALLSILSTGVLLLLHKAKDDWRQHISTNLLDGIYAPCSKMISILANVVITVLWLVASVVTIYYHAALKGRKFDDGLTVVPPKQGPLSSWGELAFTILCTFFASTLLILQIVQRRATSQEMKKAILSRELEY
ncbi:hypothetical protein CC1G_12315 [Coprinopsis cinerea okayama7|uniref:MARVEL domain-containing protein n=1 Tax=Coprinopsis cinerea (strain Okayama-7 / 130 / ATCC MYA-4618 / FGSC 9003) TaxID=240176 RepID=A8NLW1_COPC7|nr:hypothetical protein CC1G_12315 [Coprinopsis cinerea okayama7\|eukprot:XP_001834788.1 hypothetical protein CC1G_12315 [Coprinopsis cinerea okayama7\